LDFNIISKSIEAALSRFGCKIIYVYREEHGDPEPGLPVDSLGLHSSLVDALKSYGIRVFYKFQVEAINAIMSGLDTMIVSGTGTGKTEAFLVPIIDYALKSGGDRPIAILVYPTKALSRDQVHRLRILSEGKLGINVAILDGDTPQAERRAIYDNPPHILVTNPDMIHYSLVFSKGMRGLISRARFIVFDEFHLYNGVFGSHIKWIIYRMLKYAENPILVGSGATIGNPEDIGYKIFNRKPIVVYGPKRRRGTAYHYLVDSGRITRWSLAALIASILAKNGLKALVFTDSQQMAELIARIIVKNYSVKVGVHRAGLSAEYRKNIEEAFKRRDLQVVVATPTLEFGLDIGDLDAVIMTGLPRSYSSYIQRAGRAGRRGRIGLIYTILGDDSIEAYFSYSPKEFFEQEIPPSYIESSNSEVAKIHLAAMIAEGLGLSVSSIPQELALALSDLLSRGLVKASRGRVYANLSRVRALLQNSSIRSSGPIVRIFSEEGEIGFRELPMTLFDLYPGAIYYHAGKPYISQKLDLESLRVTVRSLPVEIGYYTRPLYTIDVESIKPIEDRLFGSVKLEYGDLKLTVRVEGYTMREEYSGALISEVQLEKPITWSYWTKGIIGKYPNTGFKTIIEAISSYHALEHTLISASKPVAGLADTDVGGVSYPSGHIIIYDSSPGGNGASKLIFNRIDKIAKVAEEIMANCSCTDGCPKCVYSPYCGNNNKLLSRRGALKLLRSILSKAIPQEEIGEPEGNPIA